MCVVTCIKLLHVFVLFPSGPANASGWGVPPSSERAKDEALFNSLSPAVGMVTGEQVRGVFASSGLPQGKLAQIW